MHNELQDLFAHLNLLKSINFLKLVNKIIILTFVLKKNYNYWNLDFFHNFYVLNKNSGYNWYDSLIHECTLPYCHGWWCFTNKIITSLRCFITKTQTIWCVVKNAFGTLNKHNLPWNRMNILYFCNYLMSKYLLEGTWNDFSNPFFLSFIVLELNY